MLLLLLLDVVAGCWMLAVECWLPAAGCQFPDTSSNANANQATAPATKAVRAQTKKGIIKWTASLASGSDWGICPSVCLPLSSFSSLSATVYIYIHMCMYVSLYASIVIPVLVISHGIRLTCTE